MIGVVVPKKSRPMKVVNPYLFDAFCTEVDLSSKVTVFVQFYQWLEKEIGLVDANSMHSRCRVGPLANDRLRKLELKRLRKVHKLKGKEVQRALFWTDTGSGPAVIQGFEIYVDEDRSHKSEWT